MIRDSLRKSVFCFFLLSSFSLYSDTTFKVVVLGSGGGPLENNLSGYLFAAKDSENFIAVDAGTLLSGIFQAQARNSFQDVPLDPSSKFDREATILRSQIKGYLISHPHLDHVGALVINSTIDTKKPILGTSFTINSIRDHLFNWKIWPNFGSEGIKPHLNQYQYQRLKMQQRTPIPDFGMTVEAFPLSHPDGYLSTAFLIEHKDRYILYFGDTSPDTLEPKQRMRAVWERVAPLIRENRLTAIFLECSYSDRQKTNELFGHLDPRYMMEELQQLASLVDPTKSKTSLAGFKVVVTHIKSTLLKQASARDCIEFELRKLNDLGIDFIFPVQGEKLEF
jgi:3',5'-cyclic-nucleotide phosphodiesterase